MTIKEVIEQKHKEFSEEGLEVQTSLDWLHNIIEAYEEEKKTKKGFTIFLHDGKEITVYGNTWEEVILNIDKVLDAIKENTCYYDGCDDDTVIEQLKEDGLID